MDQRLLICSIPMSYLAASRMVREFVSMIVATSGMWARASMAVANKIAVPRDGDIVLL
jgi:hypothetical protein